VAFRGNPYSLFYCVLCAPRTLLYEVNQSEPKTWTPASWVMLLLPSAIRLGTWCWNRLCMSNGRVGAEGNESSLRNANLYRNFATCSNSFFTPLLLWFWPGILDKAYYDYLCFMRVSNSLVRFHWSSCSFTFSATELLSLTHSHRSIADISHLTAVPFDFLTRS
jgi:hypothetical protein